MYGKKERMKNRKKIHFQYNGTPDLNEKHEEIPIGRKLYVGINVVCMCRCANREKYH